MWKRFFPGIIVVLTLGTAFSSAGQGADDQAIVALDAATCRSLVNRAGSVSADYQPGVDVHGRPVAPADLPKPGAPGAGLPGEITIDLRMTFSDLLGARAPAKLGQSITNVGKLTIDPMTGRTMINGEPVTGRPKDVNDIVLKACREFLARPQGQERK